jgi:hypothetical protein
MHREIFKKLLIRIRARKLGGAGQNSEQHVRKKKTLIISVFGKQFFKLFQGV